MGGPSKSLMNNQVGLADTTRALMPQFQNYANTAASSYDPLTAMAKNYAGRADAPYKVGSGLIDNLVKHYSDIAGGNNTALQREIAPTVQSITQGTDQTKQRIMDNLPRSGVRDLALEQADMGKVSNIGQATNSAYNDSFAKLSDLATKEFGLSQEQLQNVLSSYGMANQSLGLAGQQLGGSVSAGNSAQQGYKSVLDAQGQQKSAMMGLIGSLAGAGADIASAGVTKCWIAAALYGPWTPEFFAARRFIFHRWKGHTAHAVRWMYLRYGKRVARMVARSATLRAIFKPLFDMAVSKGMV